MFEPYFLIFVVLYCWFLRPSKPQVPAVPAPAATASTAKAPPAPAPAAPTETAKAPPAAVPPQPEPQEPKEETKDEELSGAAVQRYHYIMYLYIYNVCVFI